MRRGSPALLAIVLVAFDLSPAARADASEPYGPDALTAQRVRLRVARAGRRDGRAAFVALLRDRAPRGGLRRALRAGRVTVTVAAPPGFAAAARLAECAGGQGRLVCRDAGRTVRLVVRRTRAPGVLAVGAGFRRLPRARTGGGPLTGPARVALVVDAGDAPADLVAACTARDGAEIECVDARGPNILLVNTDDQRSDTLPYLPTVWSRLAPEGVVFTNAYVSTPVCCPSRASLLSGLYAHHHGVLHIAPPAGGAPRFVGPDRSTLATWLHDGGYRTGLFGKYLNGYHLQGPPFRDGWYVPPGWDVWRAFPVEAYTNYRLVHEDGTTTGYGSADADYSTTVIGAELRAFVAQSVAAGVPFFAYFAPFAPHIQVPGYMPVPSPDHRTAFASFLLPRPPSFNEADVSDKPTAIRMLPLLTSRDVAFLQTSVRNALAATLAVDDVLAAVLRTIAEAGQDANTVVVFTADNGLLWGEHRARRKELPYDEAIRVPLVVRAPGRAVPHVETGFTMNVDLAPTLAELAGVLPPTPVDGASLRPALEATGPTPHDDVLLESWRIGGGLYFAGIRTARWKYVEWPETAERELYDLDADPHELANLAPGPGHDDVLASLAALLRDRHAGATP